MGSAEQKLINEYRQLRDMYLELDSYIYDILERAVREHNLFVLDISHRVKGVESLRGKFDRKMGKYKKLSEITDLVGFRIIPFFSDAVDEVTSFLPEYFVIDEENSVDKRKSLTATEFGYVSVHYICSLKEADLEKHPEFRNIRFEIQLRSVLQHAWAEIEHDLGYKAEFGIPVPMRREFSRVAGLLEIADNQFIELREGIRKYEFEVKEKIRNDEAGEITIDRVSLREFVSLNTNFRNLLDAVSEVTGVEIQIIDPVNYLQSLAFLNIKTLGDLTSLVENNKAEAVKECITELKLMELDITTSNMIIRCLCKAEIERMKYPEDFVREFLCLSVGDPERVEKYVSQYLNNINNRSDLNEQG